MIGAPAVQSVDNEESLAAFRRERLSPASLLREVDAAPITLINVAVGVGKSHALDNLLDEVLSTNEYDTVLVLSELNRNIDERRLIREESPQALRLRPRPRDRCGSLDEEWTRHERQGTTAWAKKHLCGGCPSRPGCPWPKQYGKQLVDYQAIFGTHALLDVAPGFVGHVRRMTGAERFLLVLDEAAALRAPMTRTFRPKQLAAMAEAIRNSGIDAGVSEKWITLLDLMKIASDKDLSRRDWDAPRLNERDSLRVQESGLSIDQNFRWIAEDVVGWCRSKSCDRGRNRRGSLWFTRRPYLADKTLVLSAELDAQYAKRQLGVTEIHEPLQGVRVQHRDTRVFNLATLIGADAHYGSNHPQVLDFFAQLIMRNEAAGNRTLLVCRKHRKERCCEFLNRRLAGWESQSRVWEAEAGCAEGDPLSVPLIHYGLVGVNDFEGFDAAYCVTSYYLAKETLRDSVLDGGSDFEDVPIDIRAHGSPKRREAGCFQAGYRYSNADETVKAYHRQLEATAVIQAVGRVRYATKPREVILFQAGDVGGIEVDREFTSLAEAREFFGVLSGAEYDRRRQEVRAMELQARGQTHKQIAVALGVSERTVRYRLQRHRERSGEAAGE